MLVAGVFETVSPARVFPVRPGPVRNWDGASEVGRRSRLVEIGRNETDQRSKRKDSKSR